MMFLNLECPATEVFLFLFSSHYITIKIRKTCFANEIGMADNQIMEQFFETL